MAGAPLSNREPFGSLDLALDPALVELPVELRKLWPKLLVDMLDVARQALHDAGASEPQAQRGAVVVLRALARYHGGHSHYLPTGEALDEALMHWRIWRDSGRIPVRDLAKQHGLTDVSVYRIIARQQALARALVQPDLFAPPANSATKTNTG